jgi:hypothetical protein
MLEKEGHIRFLYLKIQLKSSMSVEVNGYGDLFITSIYVRFRSDDIQTGYHQCGIIPWDEISYISYDRI